MRTEKIAGYKVEIYESIDELPIKRFHKFNKYMLVDAGIGSDLNDINEHIAKISRFIDSDTKSAKQELENLRQSLFMVSEGMNVKHLSFVTLIHSINGELITDLSDENIKAVSKRLSNVKRNTLEKILNLVKKKIDTELDLYFPGHFNDASIKEYYDRLRRKVLLQLDSVIRGNDNELEIDKIDDFLLTLAKPKTFSGKESVEIKYDKQFEEMCLFLQQEVQADVDKMTVLQFYNSFEYIKKQKKPHGR